MGDLTEETHPRVFETISQVVELVADDRVSLATERLVALVAEFPKEGLAHAYLAWALSRGGRHREAIEHGKAAVQRSPRSERVSLLFFRVLWSAGEREQALDEMRRFVALEDSEEYAQ
ncbi:MAG: BTAD domain-containing putative transcriptional regulator, partial [Terracidiphilus sp.]